MSTFGPYPATVLDMHDGDTAVLDIDLGFGVRLPGQSWAGKRQWACRVFGINAPELNTDAGKVARGYAQTVLVVGDICAVTSHGWDAYSGRFDGEITLSDGSDFATRMVDSGHAIRKVYK